MEYKDVFPIELSKRVTPNHGLGDKIEIMLVSGTESIQ